MMSQRDFNELADALHAIKPDVWVGPRGGMSVPDRARRDQWEDDVLAVANACRQTNPRFKTELFVRVCQEGRVR